MKFLETITAFGDDILIPIDQIKFISIKYVTQWEIHINGGEQFDIVECFGEKEDEATKRYEIIKKIIEAA